MPKVRRVMSYGFVANFIRFPTVQKFKNRLTFGKVTESLKVGTFLRHSVVILAYLFTYRKQDNHYTLMIPSDLFPANHTFEFTGRSVLGRVCNCKYATGINLSAGAPVMQIW